MQTLDMKAYSTMDNGASVATKPEAVLGSIVSSIREGKMIFFFGAGVSAEFPTLLPQANKLQTILWKMLKQNVDIELPAEALKELQGLRLEVILDYYCRTLGEDALEFYDVLKDKFHTDYGPNFRHYFLASLAKCGYCKLFLTVNFDTACEAAFDDLGVPYLVPEIRKWQEKRLYDSQIILDGKENYILKLHGTLNQAIDPGNTNLLATVERVGIGLPAYKQELIQELSKKNEVFFLGYNSEVTDVDVFPVFARSSSSPKVFWFAYEGIDRVCREVRLLVHRGGGYVITGSLDDILRAILEQLGIDTKVLLAKAGLSDANATGKQLVNLRGRRDRELERFIRRYKNNHFSSPMPAYLILASIMQKPGLWDVARSLLDKVERLIPQADPDLKYIYLSNLAEVSRHRGALSEAIRTRIDALAELGNTDYKEEKKRKHAIHQVIRNGSDYMGLFKTGFKLFSRAWRATVLRSGVKNFGLAILSFFRALRMLHRAGRGIDEFDRGTLQSMLNFEVGDFFQFLTESSFYLALLVSRKSSRAFAALKYLARLPAFFSECFYRLSVERITTQSSDWFFFQKLRLAEVIMHHKRRVSSEVDRLIQDVEVFSEWGKPVALRDEPPETEAAANLRVCQGIRQYYRGDASCVSAFTDAYEIYKREDHPSGMFKATLYISLSRERLGQTASLSRDLSDLCGILTEYT